jgi:hypothetical protein
VVEEWEEGVEEGEEEAVECVRVECVCLLLGSWKRRGRKRRGWKRRGRE